MGGHGADVREDGAHRPQFPFVYYVSAAQGLPSWFVADVYQSHERAAHGFEGGFTAYLYGDGGPRALGTGRDGAVAQVIVWAVVPTLRSPGAAQVRRDRLVYQVRVQHGGFDRLHSVPGGPPLRRPDLLVDAPVHGLGGPIRRQDHGLCRS